MRKEDMLREKSNNPNLKGGAKDNTPYFHEPVEHVMSAQHV